jgi:hypothetical protein
VAGGPASAAVRHDVPRLYGTERAQVPACHLGFAALIFAVPSPVTRRRGGGYATGREHGTGQQGEMCHTMINFI